MTRAEVAAFIRAELVALARDAAIALLVDGDERHPAVLFLRGQGAHRDAQMIGVIRRVDVKAAQRVAELRLDAMVGRLTDQLCGALPNQGERTLLGIRDALGMPKPGAL